MYVKRTHQFTGLVIILFICLFVIINIGNITGLLYQVLNSLGINSRNVFLLLESQFLYDSGRNSLFAHYWALIKSNPILGFGIYGMWISRGLGPHNMIFELFLAFGIPLSSFFLFYLIWGIIKIPYTKNENAKKILLIFFSINIPLFFVSGDILVKYNLYVFIVLLYKYIILKKGKTNEINKNIIKPQV
jgi:O-antigen ligase